MKISAYRFLLPALLLSALLLRLWGIQFGLPHLYHADEPVVVNHALAYGTGDLNPHFFRIPPLVSYLLFILYGLFFLVGKVAGLFASLRDFETSFYADPTVFYLLARVVMGALAGTLTVWAYFRLIQKHFGRALALVGAFFLAVCFIHVRDSHYVYTDIPLVLVIVLTFVALFRLADQPGSLRRHLQTGALIGLATAVKYNGCFLVLPYLYLCVASSSRFRRGAGSADRAGQTMRTRGWLLRSVLYTAGVALTVYAVLNPYSLLDIGFFLREMSREAGAHAWTGWLHHFRYSLAGGIGWPLLIAACLGLVKAFTVRDPKRMAVAVFLISYYGVIVLAGQYPERYVLPLIPAVLFLAADFLVGYCRRFVTWRWLWAAVMVAAALPTILSTYLVLGLADMPDTRTLALNWIEKNIPADTRIALDTDHFMPRLTFSREQLLEKRRDAVRDGPFTSGRSRKLDYLLERLEKEKRGYHLFFLTASPAGERPLFARPAIAYDWNALRREGVEYVVAARTDPRSWQSLFFQELSRFASRVAAFNPYRNARYDFSLDRYAVTGLPFLPEDLAARQNPGPPIEIYRVSETVPAGQNPLDRP